MLRFFPPAFTPSDVTSMLALLDATAPYIDTEKGRAYFELADPKTSPFPPIFVALRDGEDVLFARRAAAEAITVLPYLHAWVVGLPDDPDYSDEYWVSHLDVGHGEIDAVYIGSVNALWHNSFRKDPAGRWRPVGDNSSVVRVPGTS
jgi:hypothetical protein